ncbi:2-aminoethylphosphonate--pyruvate transaminase [Fusobacterium perfoetens]|uniref:2-aminoethylphosphonate--pyruvate transaminase n=1 Tax=Fusobacterium perfoetens TaxID=852 RepID=UPI001F23BC51|nr:2-aminoethylphosphonate--pyruvate transaminase [Fusobacterium perfoetens]MCF2625347.1 2-aminoethylphosphonate--pyruvate transaminase [Fusobacterium perfoetens]
MDRLDECLKRPYLLLTPGPLSTSRGVRTAMLKDWCTWDKDYNNIVEDIRKELVSLCVKEENREKYTAVLMQGSGSFGVESVIGTAVPKEKGKLLVLANGAYGNRMGEIASVLGLNFRIEKFGDKTVVNPERVREIIKEDSEITHVSVVHSETTSGILNPVFEIGKVVKEFGKTFIVDAMSSFGGVCIDLEELQADFIISSSNKCIQGVPGFSFIICKRDVLEKCSGQARSLSLDLYNQWKTMEENHGKWRFTSPTHTVRAFYQALAELREEGGIKAREARYTENNKILREGMKELGFETLISEEYQSPIITSFIAPESEGYNFERFYQNLKKQGFVIYPGKVTEIESFRIGNIGEVYSQDIRELLEAVKKSIDWK